jgi:hypothetical protein
MALPAYLKVKDESVYYSGTGEFLLFVPELYFNKRGIATTEGVYIELLGILNYSTISSADDKNYTKNLKTFYFPSKFITKPGRVEKIKNFAITKNYVKDYRVLHYTNNDEDQIIVSTKVPQDIDNVEDFFRLCVDSSNVPNTIPYEELYKYYLDSIKINGSSYNLPASLFGLLISELCRDPKDINKPFRWSTALDEDSCSYTPISVKDAPKLVSPFTSLTSENFDHAVVGAIMNKNNMSTPLERVLMG